MLELITQRYLYPSNVSPPSPLYARVAVVKLAYVIPVSSEALTSTQRVVALLVCLCHLYVIVPDWSTVAAATNVPAPLEDVDAAGCVPTVITSNTSVSYTHLTLPTT